MSGGGLSMHQPRGEGKLRPAKQRLGILLSGRGSNFLAIHDNILAGKLGDAEIAMVISNVEEAPGIQAARERGLASFVIQSGGRKRAEHDAEIFTLLHDYHVDLVCLAGYMRLLSPEFISAFPQRILNIHPSLLPAFPGLAAQRQAWDYGVKVAGCTVHFVDEHLDHGVIILQQTVPVHDQDTEKSLAKRILDVEHIAYTEAIRRVISGRYEVLGRRYVLGHDKLFSK